VELGVLNTWGYLPRDVEVVGDLAYVPDEYGLHIFDVSNPAFPLALGAFDMPSVARDVEVVGDLAYVADGGAGLRVIDVSNPAAPVELGALDTPDYAVDVAVAGDLAYVADYDSGLRILDFGPEYAPSIEVDLDIKPGGDPNSINPDDGGVVPAAILGSDTFDVAYIDGMTLAFGPDGIAPAHNLSDPAEFAGHLEDVDGDDFLDLVAHFRTEETGIVFGTLVACLEGKTLDGTPFRGCDAVRTVPDMDGDGLLDVEEATLGTNALSRDTDGDGFTDGDEVLVFRTDPLDPLDPTPVPEPSRWLLMAAGAGALVVLRRMSRER
jgi:hypothetical protein